MDVNGIGERHDFEKIKARFMSKINIGAGGGCWNWTDAPHTTGYGVLSIIVNGSSRLLFAHRLAYFFAFGEIPASDGRWGTLLVCHRCDNRLCVNPAHLFLGTDGDNMRDKTAKGRNHRPVGMLSPTAKLTDDQVRQIRADNRDRHELAKAFGINESTVRNIRSRKTWRHLAA